MNHQETSRGWEAPREFEQPVDIESFELLMDPEFRRNIRQATHKLMQEITDFKIDTVVFLDKSARPFAWLLKELWKHDQKQDPQPEIRFVNPSTGIEAHALSTERYGQGVRGAFADETGQARGVEQLRETFGHQFDEKRVLIVDEIKSSGATLDLTMGLFLRAFPQTQMKTTYLFTTDQYLGMPWTAQGRLGIVEADEKIFVEPLTQGRADQIRNKMVETFEKNLTDDESPSSLFETFRFRFRELGEKRISKTVERMSRSAWMPLAAWRSTKQALECTKVFEQTPPSSDDPHEWAPFLLDIYQAEEALNEWWKSLEENTSATSNAQLMEDKHKIGVMSNEINDALRVFRKVVNHRAAIVYAAYRDVEELQRLAKQFRNEIKAVAQESD